MRYSKILANNEIDNYIDILEDVIFDSISNNKDSNLNFDDLVNISLNEAVKGGIIDLMFPVKKNHKFLANKWRKNNIKQDDEEEIEYYDKYKGDSDSYNENNIKKLVKRENHNENLKYNICDDRYCFSFEDDSYPIAKLGNRLIYINRENHNSKCEGKMLKALEKEKFKLIPNLNKHRDCIYISASSGAGKTYFAKEYIKIYKKIYPKRKIYLFGKKDTDISIDDINPIRIKIDQKYIDDKSKLDYKLFDNSVVIFDDAENISSDPKIKKEIINIRNEILNLGRDKNITIIILTHVTMNYQFTKNIISECNIYVIFPKSGQYNQYIQFLITHVGLSKKQAKAMLNVYSRWLVIFNECPVSFMTENKIFMNIND